MADPQHQTDKPYREWKAASAEVESAYRAWVQASAAERTDAHVVFVAATDREGAAFCALRRARTRP